MHTMTQNMPNIDLKTGARFISIMYRVNANTRIVHINYIPNVKETLWILNLLPILQHDFSQLKHNHRKMIYNKSVYTMDILSIQHKQSITCATIGGHDHCLHLEIVIIV